MRRKGQRPTTACEGGLALRNASQPEETGLPMFDPYHKWLGNPPMAQPPNHYRLRGIDLFEADPDVMGATANKQMAYVQGSLKLA